jgi:hypothetical protein
MGVESKNKSKEKKLGAKQNQPCRAGEWLVR